MLQGWHAATRNLGSSPTTLRSWVWWACVAFSMQTPGSISLHRYPSRRSTAARTSRHAAVLPPFQLLLIRHTRSMEFAAIVAGVVAGIGSGFLSAVSTPFVQRRAEETKLRTQARRERIDQGRALLDEARRDNWSNDTLGRDPRFTELRQHLPESVQRDYEVSAMHGHPLQVGHRVHNELMEAIDALEAKWKLI